MADQINLHSYNWAADAGTLSWGTADQPPDTVLEDERWILAIRYYCDTGNSHPSDNIALQFRERTIGVWTDIAAPNPYFLATAPALYTTHLDGDTVTTAQFQANSKGGKTAVNGEFSSYGMTTQLSLAADQQRELWFALQVLAAAVGKDFEFRLKLQNATTTEVSDAPVDEVWLTVTQAIASTFSAPSPNPQKRFYLVPRTKQFVLFGGE